MHKRTGFLLIATAVAATLLLAACSRATQSTESAPASTVAAGHVSDKDVTEHVKTALRQNASLRAFDINVVTLKGDVRLIGVVDNQAEIDEAVRVARASDGAYTVHNELTLRN